MVPVDEHGFHVFDWDRATGRVIWVKTEGDGSRTFRVDTPVQSILDANQEAYNSSTGERFGDWRRVASVPLDFLHQSGLHEAQEQQDDKFISKVLNDSDNRKFRTFGGQL